jgi:hypothetical protein
MIAKHTTFLIVSLLFILQTARSQERVTVSLRVKYSGTVVDSVTNEPLPGAVINDVSLAAEERIAVKTYIADKDGKFNVTARRARQRRLEISHVGYKLHVQTLPENEQEINLGKIKMAPDIYQLDELVVTSRMALSRISGDTILYFPRAVKTMQGDAIIEILRQMPGVTVTKEGDVFIEGKRVEKTYFNGRLLFGDDARTPLATIDAKDARLIQAYDEVDEHDEILHGKNARKRKVLNILTFEDFTRVFAAEARLEGGVDRHARADGTRERYWGNGKAGSYSEPLQLELKGGLTNLNRTLPVGYAPSMPRQGGGYNRDWNAGLNVAIHPDTINNYSVDYNHGNNVLTSATSSTYTYFPTGLFNSQRSENASSSRKVTSKHDATLKYDRVITRAASLLVLGMFQFNRSNDTRDARTETSRDGMPLLLSIDKNDARANSLTANVSMQMKKRLEKGALALNLALAFLNNESTSSRDYTLTRPDSSEIKLLKTSSKSPLFSLTPSLSYTLHDLLAPGTLSLESRARYTTESTDRLALNTLTGTREDVYSGEHSTRSLRLNEAIKYNLFHKGEKGTHYIRLQVEYSGIFLRHDERFPDLDPVRRSFHAIVPGVSYQFSKNAGASSSISLSGMHQGPYSLSRRINDANPLFITAGNPDLKAYTQYSLTFSRDRKYKKGHALSLAINATLSHRQHVSNRTYFTAPTVLPLYGDYTFPAGSTLNVLVNGTNAFTGSIKIGHDRRISPIKSTLKLAAGYTYSNPQDGIDGILVRSRKQTGLFTLNLLSQPSSTFRAELSSNTEYTRFKNSSGHVDKRLTGNAEVKTRWDFLERAYVQASYRLEYIESSALPRGNDYHVLDASVGCRVFKSRKGSLSLNAYDIFDRTNNLQVSTTDQYTSSMSSQFYSRYFTVAFEYRFNNTR